MTDRQRLTAAYRAAKAAMTEAGMRYGADSPQRQAACARFYAASDACRAHDRAKRKAKR